MSHRVRRWSLGAALLASGCSGHHQDAVQVLLPQIGNSDYYNAPASIAAGGKILTLYRTADGHIGFYDGQKTIVLDGGAKQPGGGHLSLKREGGSLYAMWWQKTPPGAKYLYLSASYDGGATFSPVRIVNAGGGVLASYELASNAKGSLAVAYQDERSGHYEVFANASQDDGKTWPDKDILLSKPGAVAFEPQLVFTGERFVATWKETGDKTVRVVCRTSGDGGRTWGPEVEIDRNSAPLTADILVVDKGRLYLFGEISDKGIVGYRSDDAGSTWQALGSMPGTQGSGGSQLAVAPCSEGLCLVFAGKPQSQKGSKFEIFSGAMTPDGKWAGSAVRVDRKAYDLTNSLNPDLIALPGGAVLAAWEDYRSIRPDVCMGYSGDGGRSWSEPACVDHGRNATMFPKLVSDSDHDLIFYVRYPNDKRDSQQYLYTKVELTPGKGITGLPEFKEIPLEHREARLRERVNEFWKLRSKNDFAEIYKLYDPAYRTAVTQPDFAKFQGNVVYHNYKLDGVDIKGNIATAKVKTNVEVRPTLIAGRSFTMAPRDDTVTMEWVWVDNDWYFVYKTPFKNQYLQY
jgi:hypothetical protein